MILTKRFILLAKEGYDRTSWEDDFVMAFDTFDAAHAYVPTLETPTVMKIEIIDLTTHKVVFEDYL